MADAKAGRYLTHEEMQTFVEDLTTGTTKPCTAYWTGGPDSTSRDNWQRWVLWEKRHPVEEM